MRYLMLVGCTLRCVTSCPPPRVIHQRPSYVLVAVGLNCVFRTLLRCCHLLKLYRFHQYFSDGAFHQLKVGICSHLRYVNCLCIEWWVMMACGILGRYVTVNVLLPVPQLIASCDECCKQQPVGIICGALLVSVMYDGWKIVVEKALVKSCFL